MQMRFEFDLARKELENQALKTKQLLQEAKLKQLQERRHWQYAVVILLLLVMGMLALHQFNRSRKMRRLAMTDDLTGLHNRRQIQAKGQAWFKQAREHGKTLSVLQLDIDHFKQVNDTLGHHMGDKVLAEVASCVAAQLRSLDRVGRNGGEEFLVLLPDTSLDEAVEVAERIRHRVAQLRIDGMPEGQPVHVSIGCAQYSPSTRASAIWCSGPTRPCTGPAGGPQPGDAGRVGRAGHPARLQSRAGYFSLARV